MEASAPKVARPELLPDRYQARLTADGLHRVVCDYLAGMTDRFCTQKCDSLPEE